MNETMSNEFGVPAAVDRSTFQAALDALRGREKAHTREGDGLAGRLAAALDGHERAASYERTSYRSVVSPECRAFRRAVDWQPLIRSQRGRENCKERT